MLARTNIYLPKQIIQTLKREASETRTTMSDIIRNALIQRQETQGGDVRYLLTSVRKYSKQSKIKDLSESHDRYLYNL